MNPGRPGPIYLFIVILRILAIALSILLVLPLDLGLGGPYACQLPTPVAQPETSCCCGDDTPCPCCVASPLSPEDAPQPTQVTSASRHDLFRAVCLLSQLVIEGAAPSQARPGVRPAPMPRARFENASAQALLCVRTT